MPRQINRLRSSTGNDLPGVRFDCRVRPNLSIALNWDSTYFDGQTQRHKRFSVRVYGYAGGFWRAAAWRCHQEGWLPELVRVPKPKPEDMPMLDLYQVPWREEMDQTHPGTWPGDAARWLAILPTMDEVALDRWLGIPKRRGIPATIDLTI